MNSKDITNLAGMAILIGTGCMLLGAALNIISGADLDKFLYENDIAGYLAKAESSFSLLIANFSIWILGVIIIGMGAILTTLLSRNKIIVSQLVRYNYFLAIPLVVVAYMVWLAFIVNLSQSEASEAPLIAQVVGWFATHADWLSTALVLGTGPILITAAGKDIWAPNWLRTWSYLAFIAGMVNIIAQFTGGFSTYGVLILPIGLGWMIATGIVLLRKSDFQI